MKSNKDKFTPHNFRIGSICPECNESLVFAESSFYCWFCGFCETDGLLAEKVLVKKTNQNEN